MEPRRGERRQLVDPQLPRADGVRSLLFPRSVAVVGVSDRTPVEVVENLRRGSTRAVGIHPRHRDVHGLPCAPSVGDLPERPELAFLLVGHRHIETAFDDALGAGIRAFVIPGLGNEAGAEGSAVAQRVAAAARDAGAAVIGPNCMGVAVPGGPSCWIGTVPPTYRPGHVAAVVQSGSIGEALLAGGPRVGFRCVVSSGGEAVTDVADLCAFFAEDDGTRAVALFLETVRRPAALAAALGRLADARKPVVCCKVGRSPAAARAVLAHTGALVGSPQAFSAVLRAYGVIEVDDYPDLLEVMEVLGRRRLPLGTRIGGVSNSGGEAALLADRAEAAGMPFAPLSAALADRLRAAFPNYGRLGNPVDAWAIDAVDRVFPGTLRLLADSGEFDVVVAQVDQSQFLGRPEAANALLITGALADAVEGSPIFPAVTSVQACDPTPAVAELAEARDVALLRGPGPAMRALAAVARWHPARPVSRLTRPPVDLQELIGPDGPLPEYESAAVLERYGVRIAPRLRASSPELAAQAASTLGFPVVVKVDGPAHKSHEGGVALNLTDAASVEAAARRLGPPVLVAAQVRPGVEVFCGVTRDPDYGPVLAVGLGGAGVEARGAPAVALAPVDGEGAARLVAQVSALAAAAPHALAELAAIVVALGRLATEHREIAAVDVNPVILGSDGAVAVDALVEVRRGDP